MALTLAVMGHLDVCFGHEPVSLPAKSQALLVYLAFAGRPVRREFLADMFWGDAGTGGSRANLRLALTRLRQALPGVITADAQVVGLDATHVREVDALALLEAAAAKASLPASVLRAAVDRYRGTFLQDFFLHNCPDFEDWVGAQRNRIDRHAVILLRELTQSARQSGDVHGMRHCLERWADLEPWNEEAVLPLMSLLAEADAAAFALDRYEACRKALAEEKAVRPGAAVEALAQRIRQGGSFRTDQDSAATVVPGPQAPTAAAEPRAADVAVDTSVPPGRPDAVEVTPLFGRDNELREIRERIRQGERLVMLLGPAGIGKSRLSRTVAREMAVHYPDGTVSCSFDFLEPGATPEASRDHFIATLGSALGLDFTQTTQPMTLLSARLRNLQAILCLEGFEACPGATPTVLEVLGAAPHSLILLTSRVRLAATEGWACELRGLTARDAADGGAEAGEPAVDLLVACAQRAGIALDGDTDHACLSRLTRQLDGSPLAIQFAAQSLRLMSPRQLCEKLDSGGWPDSSLHLPGYRYDTLHDVMADVWSRLDTALQTGWARCALFKGSFTLEWARDCAALDDSSVLALVDRSILWVEPDRRLRMHELTRQYGLTRLDQLAQAEDYRLAFVQATLERLVELSPALVREDTAAVDSVRPDISTLASAMDMALQRYSALSLNLPLQALCRAYHRLGWSYAAVHLLEQVLQRHQEADVNLRIPWHLLAAEATRNVYGYQRAGAHFKKAAALGGAWLPRGWWRAVAAGLAACAQALLTRPHKEAVQRDAQEAVTQAMAVLLLSRYTNGSPGIELAGGMAIAWRASRRSGSTASRLAMFLKVLNFMPASAPDRLYAWAVRRVNDCLPLVEPPQRAYAVRDLGVVMVANGQWEQAETCLNRASQSLAALGYGYHALECLTELYSGQMNQGVFSRLLPAIRETEWQARRQNQPTVLRWTLVMKLQALVRMDAAGLDEAQSCLNEIHAIPVYRTPVEVLSVCGLESVLAAARDDLQQVLDKAKQVLEAAHRLGRGRYYVLFTLQWTIDAVLYFALADPSGPPQARNLAIGLVNRFLALSLGLRAYETRRCLYSGAIQALQGRQTAAVQAWQEGLVRCDAQAMPYDAARLNWLLSSYLEPVQAARHRGSAELQFAAAGVQPPYALIPKPARA